MNNIFKKINSKNNFPIYLTNLYLQNNDFEKDQKFFFSQVNYQQKKSLSNYKIYKIKEKNFQYFLKLKKIQNFLITNSNTWRLYNDQPIGFHCLFPKNLYFSEKKTIAGNFINPSLILNKSGFFIKKNGSEIVFQSVLNTFITQTSLLKKTQDQIIKKNEILGYELTYKKQAKDIVQGLPKVESLIEAYSAKNDLKNINRASIFFSKQAIKNFSLIDLKKNNNSLDSNIFEHVYFQSLLTNNIIVSYKRLFYKLVSLSEGFEYKKIKTNTSATFFNYNILETNNSSDSKESEEIEYYILRNFKKNQNFQYESKIIDIFNKNAKYYVDKYWPVYNDSIWLYKFEKFRLFKWLKLIPIVWIPGVSKNIKNNLGYIATSKSIHSNFIVKTNKGKYYFLELINLLEKHNNYSSKSIENNQITFLSLESKKLKFEFFNNFLNFIYLGESVLQNSLNIQKLLNTLFHYHFLLDGSYFGLLKSILKFQTVLGLSIEESYKSQGVKISTKNIEIIVKQMVDKVIIEDPKNTNLLPLEILKLIIIKEICISIKKYNNRSILENKKTNRLLEVFPVFKPKLFSATSSIFYKEGFLTQAGFQNTKKVLTKASIEGSLDWLTSLKQRVIVGQTLPAGSTFFNSKYNLDTIYLFKNIKNYDH